MPDRPRILILGGGFAGIGAAKKLKDAEADTWRIRVPVLAFEAPSVGSYSAAEWVLHAIS